MTSYCNFCLGVFYYLLGNLLPMLHSSLKVIQLVSIVCHSTLMKYGVDKILVNAMKRLVVGFAFIIISK